MTHKLIRNDISIHEHDMYENLFAYRRVGNMYILLCLDNMFIGGYFSIIIIIYI